MLMLLPLCAVEVEDDKVIIIKWARKWFFLLKIREVKLIFKYKCRIYYSYYVFAAEVKEE